MVDFLTTIIYKMVAYSILLAQIFVPILAAQGIIRLADPHPGLRRRVVGNCTADCNFCAGARLVTWSPREIFSEAVRTVTYQEVVNEDGSVDLETITEGWSPDDIATWSKSLSLASQGVHTSLVENLGFVM